MAVKRFSTRPGSGVPRKMNAVKSEIQQKRNGRKFPSGSALDPNFPGRQNGASVKEVRDYIKQQVRRKGYRFSGGTAPVEFPLQISGNAKFLYGIAWLGASFGTFSMMINNEQVIETTDTGFFAFGTTDNDYFAINRPLSGSDDVKITVTGDAAYVNKALILYFK